MKIIKKTILTLIALFIHISAQAGQLECVTVYPLMSGFLAQHLTQKKLSSEIEERTITQFLKALDPSKIYLMESDVQQIRKSLQGIFTKVAAKRCEDIDAAEKTYEKRVSEARTYAKEFLGPKFKFDQETSLILDPQKRKYATTKKELEDLQTKYIQFQISNYLLADTKLPEAKKNLIHRYEVTLKHVNDQKKNDLYAIFLDSFASALDPHSNFLSKDVLEDFEITMKLSLEGIGATLSTQDGYTVVENLVPGGAADKSGELQPKDKIIGVAQEKPEKSGKFGEFVDVIDMPLRDVVKLIRGKKGSKVKLSVLRQGKTTQRLVVDLVRDKIDLKDEAAKISYVDKTVGDKKLKVGVINLPSFYADSEQGTRSCSEDVKKLIKEATAKKVDGLVLDLSKNGGGVLGEAVNVAGLFIKKGVVVSTQDSDGKVESLADRDAAIAYNGPLVVLTSRLSASASEIVAGALRDYKRAVVIGSDQTFGKGSVQAVMKLREDLGAIKVTTGMFFTPSGQSTQEIGVKSDIKIPSPYKNKEFTEAALDYPLSNKSIPPLLSTDVNGAGSADKFAPVNDGMVLELSKLSKVRVEKDTEFAKIETDLKESEQKNGVIKIADMMKKTKEANKNDKKKNKKLKPEEKEAEYLAQAAIKEALNITTDLVLLERESIKLAEKTKKNLTN